MAARRWTVRLGATRCRRAAERREPLRRRLRSGSDSKDSSRPAGRAEANADRLAHGLEYRRRVLARPEKGWWRWTQQRPSLHFVSTDAWTVEIAERGPYPGACQVFDPPESRGEQHRDVATGKPSDVRFDAWPQNRIRGPGMRWQHSTCGSVECVPISKIKETTWRFGVCLLKVGMEYLSIWRDEGRKGPRLLSVRNVHTLYMLGSCLNCRLQSSHRPTSAPQPVRNGLDSVASLPLVLICGVRSSRS